MIWGAKLETINVIDLMIMEFTIMWLYDDDDDNVVVGWNGKPCEFLPQP